MYPTCSGNIDKCKNDCLLNRALEIKENITYISNEQLHFSRSLCVWFWQGFFSSVYLNFSYFAMIGQLC